MQKNARPIRISLENFQGKKISLNSGLMAFSRLDSLNITEETEHIILGLGPMGQDDDWPAPELVNAKRVFYLECAEFSKTMQEQGKKQGVVQKIPEHWQSISSTELLPLLQGRAIWWYRQNMQFNPQFWADILGKVQALLLRGGVSVTSSNSVMVAGNEQQLLYKEICTAFEGLGFEVSTVQDDLQKNLANAQPQLFFSINLRGLDPEGQNFALLQALNIPVAIWFVDNPWHILSSLRLPWWKDAKLFVTDASFIPELQRQGAKYVYHLPLAASQHMWNVSEQESQNKNVQAASEAGCIFVGRASFPEHASFFAAAKVPEQVLDEAFALLEKGERPHFHWWQERLGVELWPSNAVRSAGFGAEECARQQRVMWLRALLTVKPVIFGDSESWAKFLPEASADVFYPSLDYYTELAPVYRAAKCVLNVTSLLLPEGLTQRHFDVWAAGGFLFSNSTEGLDIFPKDLSKAISIANPDELANKIRTLSLSKREELILAWQECIQSEHSYAKRMSFVLDKL